MARESTVNHNVTIEIKVPGLISLLHRILDAVEQGSETVTQELDRLATEVTEIRTVVDSAKALIVGLAQQVRELKDDPAALAALADELDATAGDLAATVGENTEPTPEPPVDPEPTPPQF